MGRDVDTAGPAVDPSRYSMQIVNTETAGAVYFTFR